MNFVTWALWIECLHCWSLFADFLNSLPTAELRLEKSSRNDSFLSNYDNVKCRRIKTTMYFIAICLQTSWNLVEETEFLIWIVFKLNFFLQKYFLLKLLSFFVLFSSRRGHFGLEFCLFWGFFDRHIPDFLSHGYSIPSFCILMEISIFFTKLTSFDSTASSYMQQNNS